MAVIDIDQTTGSVANSRMDFDAIWTHYAKCGLLYPANADGLADALDMMRIGWPRLFAAPRQIFQFCVGYEHQQIASSISVFRDAEQMYVIQHAASDNHPLKMLRCICSVFDTLKSNSRAQYVSFYFRPEESWPQHLVNTVNSEYPSRLASVLARPYLICRPQAVFINPSTHRQVELLNGHAAEEIAELVHTIVDPVRAKSFEINNAPLNLLRLNTAYGLVGLQRDQCILGVRHDQTLMGIAVCYDSEIPMNLNFLCNRIEIFVRPGTRNRDSVVYELASAALQRAARQGQPVCTLLIDETDIPAATRAGFQDTGICYSNAIWRRENEDGWHSVTQSIRQMVQQRSRILA